MKRIRSRSFLIASLFATGLVIMGCSSEFSSLPLSNHIQEDAPLIQFIEKNLGTDWYGIYIQESKVGFLKSTTGREKGPDGTTYIIQLSGTIQIPSQKETGEIKINVDAAFNAQPPYTLIRYSDRMMRKDDLSETRIVKTSKGYEGTITQGRETRTRVIGALEYSLKDYTAVQRWITRDPKEGDQIKYPYLNLETLTLEEKTSRITGIQKTIISGVKIFYYNVVTTGSAGLEVLEKFGADGRPYRIVLGGVFECRIEPQSVATNIDRTINLILRNTVSITRPLGDSEKVTLLKISLDNTSGAFLDDAPGQSVTRNPDNDSVIVTINSKGTPYVNATREEIEKNLAATIDIPANHPKIIRLAHNAVGDAGNDSEKISRLVKFVYQYIEDDYTANPLKLIDIIEKKRGDCSEHAKLFTAMARAVGIPCRTVGGLVYLGDEFQEFGLHAWNEVVICGVWVPVDPTWGQTLVDATHIRFPTDISEEWQVMATIPNMKMEVLHVERKK